MAAGLIEKNVDGTLYQFQQLGAKQALVLLSRLTKIVGEPLGILLGNVMKGSDAKDLKVKDILEKEINWEVVLPQAVRALIDRIQEDEVMAIIVNLTAENALCAGRKINFDTHYQGKLLNHLPKVLWAALEVQYGNFSGGASVQASPDTNAIPFQSIQAR